MAFVFRTRGGGSLAGGWDDYCLLAVLCVLVLQNFCIISRKWQSLLWPALQQLNEMEKLEKAAQKNPGTQIGWMKLATLRTHVLSLEIRYNHWRRYNVENII